ncbi:MAG: peptidoglycan DD-metalloendopeptidase family protein [Pseudomonadota bacterium]|nr:peptidoglycan DD-metalloendopeptidase family protein [Pseudomonadota bacterium]
MLAASGAVGAAKPTERSRQKAAAEASRAGIVQKLSTLKKDISRTETEKDNAADTLAESEEAISDANRALRELAGEQGATNAKLLELGAAQDKLAATIAAQKLQLARLLRQQYVAGNEDRIKLLLSGDNPNRISRELQLMAYVSQAQARLLAALRSNLAAVESNRAAAQNAKDELAEIADEQQQQKGVLEKEQARRAALLGSLSSRLVAQRKQAGALERDEQRMAGLVDQLSKLIREQAEAAAAEQRRLAALAAAKARAQAEAQAQALAQAQAQAQARQKAERAERAARAERERLAAQKAHPGAKPAAPFKPDPIDADEPKVALKPVEARPAEARPDPAAARAADIALAPAAPEGAFAGLKGQLRAPVSGRLAARFGAKRGEASWKGVFIKAAEGADVRAVAGGRVVFANWMRGFGNLIIVDHGSQYLSIYGNNQTLLKHVGDAVKGGDPIASAGNTGGNEESGLYFELRHLGQAFDPASWIKF